MAFEYPCSGCWFGDHTKHKAIAVPAKTDDSFGAGICPCEGECEHLAKSPMENLIEAIRNYRETPWNTEQ